MDIYPKKEATDLGEQSNEGGPNLLFVSVDQPDVP